MTILDDIAVDLALVSYRDLKPESRDRLRFHLADTLAAGVAGAAAQTGPTPNSRDLSGDSPLDEIASLSAIIRSTEVDDIHLGSCVTPSAAIVPVALRLAGDERAHRPAQIASAILTGIEAMTRLGEAMRGAEALYLGLWPSAAAAPFGAAATAGRCLGLEAKKLAQALAMALSMEFGRVGRPVGQKNFRWIAFGHAVRSGVGAAYLAADGYTADTDIPVEELLRQRSGLEPRIDRLLGSSNNATNIENMSLKPFCAAKQSMAAIVGVRKIIEGGVPPDSIESIEINVPKIYAGMIQHPFSAQDRLSTIVNIAYQGALAARKPDALLDVRRAPPVLDDDIRRMMQRVVVHEDPELDAAFPRSWPARVIIKAYGTSHEVTVDHTPGDPDDPFGEDDVRRKAQRLMSDALPPDDVDDWISDALIAFDDDDALERTSARFLSLTTGALDS